jgi:hypothetical protein
MTAARITSNKAIMEKVLSITLKKRNEEKLKVNLDFTDIKAKQTTIETRNTTTTFTELIRAKSYKFLQ